MHYSLTALIVLAFAMPATAQQQPSQSQQQPTQPAGDAGGGASLPPPIYSSGSSIYNSSTAVEGAGRGAAAVIQASGEYNYNTAAAMVAASQAQSQDVANSAAALNNYFTLKKINESYRALHQGNQAGMGNGVAAARAFGPRRLTPFQYDMASGEINWPAPLLRREFNDYRTRLDELFAARTAANSGLGTDNFDEIAYTIENLEHDLKLSLDDLKPAEYVLAKRFLVNLAYEAQFTPAVAAK
jgi:hypothetical protein